MRDCESIRSHDGTCPRCCDSCHEGDTLQIIRVRGRWARLCCTVANFLVLHGSPPLDASRREDEQEVQ